MSVYETIKTKVDELLNHATEVKQAVDEATTAPNLEQAIVDGLVALLEANGYTVTKNETETSAEVQSDGTSTEPAA